MKPRSLFLVVFSYAVLAGRWDAFAQPQIPKEKIPQGEFQVLILDLYSPNPWDRCGVATQLGKMGKRAAPAAPFLAGLLADNAAACVSTVGKSAADALVYIRDPAVEAVTGVFADAGAPEEARRSAATILGKIRDPRALEPLIVGLSDRAAGVPAAAAAALGELRDARAVGPLAASLKDHPSPDAVFGALEKIGAPSVEALIGVFVDNGISGGVRAKAAASLARLKDGRAIEPLIPGLADPDAGVRTAAAAALGALGNPKAGNAILPLTKSADPQQRLVAVVALIRLKDPRAGELAAAEMKVRDANTRCELLGALAKANYPGAVRYLLGALADPDGGVRSWALYKLGEKGLRPSEDPRAFGVLVSASKDGDKRVREAAVSALRDYYRQSPRPEVVDALARIMRNDSETGIRVAAGYALGGTRDPRAVEPLIKALSSWNRDVRAMAAGELRELADYRAVRPLAHAGESRDAETRMMAIVALEKMRDPRAVDDLIWALGRKGYGVRNAAAISLGKIGNPKAVEPLIEALGDKESMVRGSAARALGEIRDPRAVEPLGKTLLSDKFDTVRSRAALALGQIGGPPAVDLLVESLKSQKLDDYDRHPKGKTRGFADAQAAALVQLKSDAVMSRLIQIVGDLSNSEFFRWRAAEVLGEMEDSRAAEPLVAALKQGPQVRNAAIKSLGQIRDRRAVEPLVGIVKARGEGTSLAAEALGEIGDATAVDALIELLRDKKQRYAEAHPAAVALGKIGDRRAVEPLIQLFKERRQWYFGAAAIESLGQLKDRRAVELLIATLDDLTHGYPERAATALGEIGDYRAVEPLIELIDGPDLSARTEAVRALGKITGKSLDFNSRNWRSWWEKNKEGLLRQERQ